MWFIIVLISNFAGAMTQLLDKILVSKKMPSASVLNFWTALANGLGLLFAFLPEFHFAPDEKVIWLAILSGVCYTVALQFLYLALKKGEASHVAPFVGGIVPLAALPLSYFLMGEVLVGNQLLGVILLAAGALLMSFEIRKDRRGWSLSTLLALFAGIFFAASYVVARQAYLSDNFTTGFVYARLGQIIGILPLLFWPRFWFLLRNKEAAASADKMPWILLGLNKAGAAIYFLGISFAVSLTSATVVNALAGLQYGLLFVAALVLSKLKPRFFKEYFTRSEIIQQISSLAILGAGLALLAM